LAQADVGIAIGAGTDVAIETADIILVKSNPNDVAAIIGLAMATHGKMIQNLIWATGYNVAPFRLRPGLSALGDCSGSRTGRCAHVRQYRDLRLELEIAETQVKLAEPKKSFVKRRGVKMGRKPKLTPLDTRGHQAPRYEGRAGARDCPDLQCFSQHDFTAENMSAIIR
jgi:hypothetical protein